MRSGPCAMVLAVIVVGSPVASARAAGRVELTLATEPGAPLVAQQTWVRELGQAGVRNVRIRQQRSGDRMGIATTGTKDSPIYVVTGMINAQGDVVLPGVRFRDGEADRVARWLNDLAQKGPPELREPTAAFGLPRSQFIAMRKDLTPAVDFSTQGKSCGEIVRKIHERLATPLDMDASLVAALDKETLDVELSGVSQGAALAYLLRASGLGLIPRTSARGLDLAVREPRPGEETWPVGWPPDVPGPKLLPAMYELHTINIDNVSVDEILKAIGTQLKIPVLMDHAALAQHRIDPTKVLVTLPSRQTTYSQVLQKAVFQAKLKSELRVDEAGKPLIWITSQKATPWAAGWAAPTTWRRSPRRPRVAVRA
jgi:hypothetical protein